jgi:hypothetical protein
MIGTNDHYLLSFRLIDIFIIVACLKGGGYMEKVPGGRVDAVLSTSNPWLVLGESTKANGRYVHDRCGTEILGTTVPLSVHTDLLTPVGTGEVSRQTVPYCPSCERKPVDGVITLKGQCSIRS